MPTLSRTSSATRTISYFLPDQQLWLGGPTTPITQRLLAMTRDRFGLFPFRSPLLRESRLLSLPVGTEMFHFPTFPPHALCVQAWVTGHDSCRVSPFGNPRIKAQSAAPRGLSQPLTSFIGSWCQGIHRAPLLTWPQRCSRPLCSSQGTGDAHRMVTACPPPARPVRVVRCSMRSDVEGWSGRTRVHSLRTQQRAYAICGPDDRGSGETALLQSAVLTMPALAIANWSVFHP